MKKPINIRLDEVMISNVGYCVGFLNKAFGTKVYDRTKIIEILISKYLSNLVSEITQAPNPFSSKISAKQNKKRGEKTE